MDEIETLLDALYFDNKLASLAAKPRAKHPFWVNRIGLS
jgi:hypothetical protein